MRGSKMMWRVGAIVLAAAGTAWGQWSVTILHPPGLDDSSAEEIGPQIVGLINIDYAAWWPDGTAAGYVPLHPPGAYRSRAVVSGAGMQAGWVDLDIPGRPQHAALWRGTASSFVDLHPAGYASSRILGGGAQVQVGQAGDHAGMWRGTAGSFVSLHPAGAEGSSAQDVHDGRQVGLYVTGGVQRAAVWRGAAASMIDLHPAEAEYSLIFATHQGQHAGRVRVGGRGNAAVWNGDTSDWVGLAPPGAQSSIATDVFDGWQSGVVYSSTNAFAALWRGDAASYVDLHALLPSRYVDSFAQSVWHDGDTLYVVGAGKFDTTFEAVMWTLPMCEPDFDLDGDLTIFDFLAFQSVFAAGNPAADLDDDGMLTFFDFLTFQTAFAEGCP